MQRIMIIEDDRATCEELMLLLRNEGYDPIQVMDFTEIAEQVEREHPDLILLDIGLPGVDGFRLVIIIMKSNGLTFGEFLLDRLGRYVFQTIFYILTVIFLYLAGTECGILILVSGIWLLVFAGLELSKKAGRAMIREVSDVRAAWQEYREYVESWVHEVKTLLPVFLPISISALHQNTGSKICWSFALLQRSWQLWGCLWQPLLCCLPLP